MLSTYHKISRERRNICSQNKWSSALASRFVISPSIEDRVRTLDRTEKRKNVKTKNVYIPDYLGCTGFLIRY